MGENTTTSIKQAIKDFYLGAKEWRIWYLMAMIEIKMRYKRSKLGQFWLTLSNAINIATLGCIWSYLFKIAVKEYLPYVAVNLFLWSLLSGVITEGCQMFIAGAKYMQQIPIQKSSFAYMNVFRNLVIFGHNMVALLVVFIIFPPQIGFNIIFGLAGFILILINAVWVSLFIGIISVRFRDIPAIISSLLQLAFYSTPTIWKLESMPSKIIALSNFNPFNIFISIVRDGIFNRQPNTQYWITALGITVFGWLFTGYIFAKYRRA